MVKAVWSDLSYFLRNLVQNKIAWFCLGWPRVVTVKEVGLRLLLRLFLFIAATLMNMNWTIVAESLFDQKFLRSIVLGLILEKVMWIWPLPAWLWLLQPVHDSLYSGKWPMIESVRNRSFVIWVILDLCLLVLDCRLLDVELRVQNHVHTSLFITRLLSACWALQALLLHSTLWFYLLVSRQWLIWTVASLCDSADSVKQMRLITPEVAMHE